MNKLFRGVLALLGCYFSLFFLVKIRMLLFWVVSEVKVDDVSLANVFIIIDLGQILVLLLIEGLTTTFHRISYGLGSGTIYSTRKLEWTRHQEQAKMKWTKHQDRYKQMKSTSLVFTI